MIFITEASYNSPVILKIMFIVLTNASALNSPDAVLKALFPSTHLTLQQSMCH